MSKTLIIILSIFFLIIIFGVIGEKRRKAKLLALGNIRDVLTKKDYVNHFVDKGFDKKSIEVLHDKLVEYIGLDGYSVYPEDDLRELYGFEDLDDVEFINQIIKQLNIRELIDSDYEDTEKNIDKFNAEYILKVIKNASK